MAKQQLTGKSRYLWAILALFWASVFLPSSASCDDLPQIDNVTEMVLATLFNGDFEKTRITIEDLGQAYMRFLDHFVSDGYCNQSTDVRENCEIIRLAETRQIERGEWSENFVFDKAEFNHSLGIYNLEKRLMVANRLGCAFTLQITADLRTQALLNKEFFVLCSRL